ncbi:hypothetical protein QJQ45_007411 [Haematococcus lacustris]|nr:hypothetical protein QJQ45_007411 [Haematococcus lacustris]
MRSWEPHAARAARGPRSSEPEPEPKDNSPASTSGSQQGSQEESRVPPWDDQQDELFAELYAQLFAELYAQLCTPRAVASHQLHRLAAAVPGTVKGAKVRCNSATTGRPLALAYGAAGFGGSGSIGSKGVPVNQMRREACNQFPGRVVLVHEFRTSRVSSARTNVVQGQAESVRWLHPVRNKSRIRGLMCSTSNVIKRGFYDRDVSAALNIRRIAAGPGRPRELSSWLGRPAMPNPGRPGQEWVCVRNKGLLRKWRRRHQRQR